MKPISTTRVIVILSLSASAGCAVAAVRDRHARTHHEHAQLHAAGVDREPVSVSERHVTAPDELV